MGQRRGGTQGFGGPRAGLLLRLLVIATFLAPQVSLANNEFGRWWWEAGVGLGQRGSSLEREDSTEVKQDQNEVRVNAALNGFLGHPALGNFRLGVDLISARTGNGHGVDNRSLGYGLKVGLLPGGAYPISLYAARRRSDLSGVVTSSGSGFALIPDSATTWGGRARIRKGPFGGVLLGIDQSKQTYLDESAGEDSFGERFVSWSRSTGNFQHNLRFANQSRDFQPADYKTRLYSLNFDERAWLSPTWRWEMTGFGTQNEVSARAIQVSNDHFRLINSFTHEIRERDQLNFGLRFARTDPGFGTQIDGYQAFGSYRWRPRPQWEINPFVRVTQESGTSHSLRFPSLGMAAVWTRTSGKLAGSITGSASVGSVDFDNSFESRDETNLGYGLAGTLSHGDGQSLRKELILELSRNEWRMSRDEDPGHPSPEGFDDFAVSDYQHARGTLSHQWDSRQVSGWIDWSRWNSDQAAASGGFELENILATLQYGWAGLRLQANLGQTQSETLVLGDQEFYFFGGQVNWTPVRYLRLRALYREERRNLLLSPDLEGRRMEAGVVLHLRIFDLNAFVFRSDHMLDQGLGLNSGGFQWAITRRFAGWLPVITGTKRRGVIR